MKSESHNLEETKQINVNSLKPESRHDRLDEEIDLLELLRVIWNGRLAILLFTVCITAVSIAYALNVPNVYKASILLAPSQNKNGGGLSALAGQFGGLASMAGINVGSSGYDKTNLALAVLKSRSFINGFIEEHNILVEVLASKYWDKEKQLLVIDDDIYDVSKSEWLGQADNVEINRPSEWSSYRAFSSFITIDISNDDGLIGITLSHKSPILAKKWLGLLVHDINEYMRLQDNKQAQESIYYLQEQLKITKVSSMKSVFFQLIEEQTKQEMLTKVKRNYIFEQIDKPQVPDIHDAPKRLQMVIFGFTAGLLCSIFGVVVFKYRISKYF